LVIGFIIPASTIMLRDFFNNKITDKRDIEHMTKIPVIGIIFHNTKKTTTVISDHPKSAISESFRSVRTNLQILSQGKTKQLLVVTSSSSGEGKSFTAINLASAFALFGRKTLLLGFDLRRPMLYQDFGLTNMLGISSYLSNRALLEDIIQPTPLENLDLISAGPIPPNPVELIASDKTSEFIARLRNIYDYIIIDTAPVGVVADTYLLMNYADVNVFVARQNTTIKQNFATTIQNIENNKISNLTVLLNDVYPKKSGYGYGYDDRYYGEPKSESIFKRIFKGSGSKKRKRRPDSGKNA
ncbi:MAG TPA: CpsD/CapB family tyrosine-protein kinase, partial [Bacteroidales bacterium]|nr:CpsD/CapB family tyrosine-protein kinase [Bacteroidales bacterium]